MKQTNHISHKILTSAAELPTGIGSRARPANVAIIAGTTFVLLSVLAMTGVIPAMVSSVCLMAAALLIRWNCGHFAGRLASLVGIATIITTALVHRVPLLDMISIGAVLLASAEWMGSLRRSFEAEKTAADFDALTGAVSHYALHRILVSELDQVRQGSQRIALLFLDLDNFKEVNDREGHAAGDAVLKRLVARTSEVIGPANLIARLGGDEFLILLRGVASERDVQQMGSELGRAASFAKPGLTASIGGLVLDSRSKQGLDRILSEADSLMYAVKRDGKASHRIVKFDAPELVLAA
ncbi:sensor domain-containing diguanylate cyclase [Croceicoccus ponticola]|uniref:Sensor domain-containing diguanylate cyclase n=1 Tax=Croceicoccus ponticola TaxID=2217664 RepID=A0A437GXX1_9SPHN|nr:sensor domain-containing diguanylate cyclase [Croceicoccus ponticola]RVQ67527.1 sensor domain-containing diguanylate cyclase [Croceicoccus ponticola]